LIDCFIGLFVRANRFSSKSVFSFLDRLYNDLYFNLLEAFFREYLLFAEAPVFKTFSRFFASVIVTFFLTLLYVWCCFKFFLQSVKTLFFVFIVESAKTIIDLG